MNILYVGEKLLQLLPGFVQVPVVGYRPTDFYLPPKVDFEFENQRMPSSDSARSGHCLAFSIKCSHLARRNFESAVEKQVHHGPIELEWKRGPVEMSLCSGAKPYTDFTVGDRDLCPNIILKIKNHSRRRSYRAIPHLMRLYLISWGYIL